MRSRLIAPWVNARRCRLAVGAAIAVPPIGLACGERPSSGSAMPGLASAGASPASTVTPSGAILTLTPPPGTVLDPNSESIDTTFTVSNGNPISGAVFKVGDRVQRVDGPGPLRIAYKAPRVSAGLIEILVMTYGPGPDNYTATSHMILKASTPPESIRALPGILKLGEIGEAFQLQVTAKYPGGKVLDIKSHTAGTTCTIESGGESVITVSKTGLVEARGIGQAVVTVTNEGVSTSLRVKVAQ